ncbi:hypothetical protein EBU24_03895, partial [bacterium]|nr:hypothetical protein [bacterium]
MKKKQLGLMFAVTMLIVVPAIANEVSVAGSTITDLTKVVGGAVNTLVEGVKNSPVAQSTVLRGAALAVKAHGKDAAQAVQSTAQSFVSKGINFFKVAQAWRYGLMHAREAWNLEFAHEQSEKLKKAAQVAVRLSAATLAFWINKKIVEMGLSSSESTKRTLIKFITLFAYYKYLSPELKKSVHVLWNKLLRKYASRSINNVLSLKKYPIVPIVPTVPADNAQATVKNPANQDNAGQGL